MNSDVSASSSSPTVWACGITTVPSRERLFYASTESLLYAGFDEHTVFLDGLNPLVSTLRYSLCGCSVVSRQIQVGPYASKMLALLEMYYRNPEADRYALFEDDILVCKNAKPYLESVPLSCDEYWNLYSVPANDVSSATGFVSPKKHGQGALALVFPRVAVEMLLSASGSVAAWRGKGFYTVSGGFDGWCCDVLQSRGVSERVHNPSLVQHVGHESTIGTPPAPVSMSFRGEEFDAMELLNERG